MTQVKQSGADNEIDVELELEEVISHPPPQSTFYAPGAGVGDDNPGIEAESEAEAEVATGRTKCRLKTVFIAVTIAVLIVGVAVGVSSSGNEKAAVTSTFEKSFMKTNSKAPKSSTTTSNDSSLLCGCQECEDVANEIACGVINDYCHTCKARIDWLQTSDGNFFTEKNACKLVGKYEFPKVCGACYKCKTYNSAPVGTPLFWCNNPTCTDELFNNNNVTCDDDGCHSCKSYVEYLEYDMNFDEKEACNKVTEDFPDECPCKWNPRNTDKSM